MIPAREKSLPGVLYVVATPIGNPGDITLRALEVLRDSDIVACEDTRRTGVFLGSHQLRKPLISYFEHNEERRIPELIDRLLRGENVALVTDAGTPAISDPGFRLVCAAHDAGVRVTAIPGASAAIAALSIAGIPTNRFSFEGFLPSRDSARRTALRELRRETRTMVFYEAGRRLGDTLSAICDIFGGDRNAAVVREITKIYEETVRGSLGDLAERFKREGALGEIVVVVEGAANYRRKTAGDISPSNLLEALIDEGLSLKQASAIVAKLAGKRRRDVYQEGLNNRRVCSGVGLPENYGEAGEETVNLGSINHIALTVSDLKRSGEFYDSMLGFMGYTRVAVPAATQKSMNTELLAWAGPNGSFTLRPEKAAPAGKRHDRYSVGLNHIAINAESRDQVVELYDLLKKSGVQILDPPADYAYAPGYYAVYFTDPDGIKIEFVYWPRT